MHRHAFAMFNMHLCWGDSNLELTWSREEKAKECLVM